MRDGLPWWVFVLVFFGVLLAYAALKYATSEEDNAELLASQTSELPHGFNAFYERFHSDSAYQIAHIAFPLSGNATRAAIAQEDWILHQPFNDHNGTFVQTFDNFDPLVIEIIRDRSGQYGMERRYIVDADSEWTLVYYDPMDQLDAVEETVELDSL